MTQEEIQALVKRQRTYFRSGATLSPESRLAALKKLEDALKKYESEIEAALRADLGKSQAESYACEIGMTLSEITYQRRHLRRFMKERTVPTPLAQFCSRSYQKPSPRGVVLVMSPWNYPLLLTLSPVADALAAGNTVIVKPSAYSPHTSRLMEALIRRCFDPRLVCVVTGGREENACLLEQHFDYIFFTGSKNVGTLVMKKAAEHLTPVTLELGGKSPCIVEKSADIPTAARRIVFGKYLNCGQTCVAPDYIYCHKSIKETLIQELKKQIAVQFGPDPLKNENYGHIVNKKHFQRIQRLMTPKDALCGGRSDEGSLKIEPTLLLNADWNSPAMQEEIFGPLLPILTYESLDEVIAIINEHPHPLALYLFTGSRAAARHVTSRCAFGGGCINDTVIHLATSQMGFGGFGESGMGSYHGKAGFDTFTHYKSIVDKRPHPDLPMRYQPYTKLSYRLIKLFLK